jgi:hypothetical protein
MCAPWCHPAEQIEAWAFAPAVIVAATAERTDPGGFGGARDQRCEQIHAEDDQQRAPHAPSVKPHTREVDTPRIETGWFEEVRVGAGAPG